VALLAEDQVVAEASGALAVAAVRAGQVDTREGPVALVVSGGNIDLPVLRRLLAARA
jgi:threonine dehydratase